MGYRTSQAGISSFGIPCTGDSMSPVQQYMFSYLCCVVQGRVGAVTQHDVGRFAPVDVTDEDSHPRAITSLSAKEKAVREDEKDEATATPAGSAVRVIGRAPIMLNPVPFSPEKMPSDSVAAA